MKPATTITVIFLLIVSIVHLLRLVLQVTVMTNLFVVPMWMSVPACIVTAGLAIWLWKENKK
jgi:hypothetical protein